MDTWMVAVAAGASHIAQHFKKIKQITSESSSSSFDTSINNKPNSPKQPPHKRWPFRRLTKRDNLNKDDSEGTSSSNVTSTSEFDSVNGVISSNCEGSNVFPPSTLFPCTPRSRMQLRNRRAMKPLTSLESCYMAQLQFDHVEMKEYMKSPFVSPSLKTIRPFVVTDGSKVISKSSGGTFMGMGNDAMLHVCIGMSFGILYSFMENKREVEKLNRLLKQTESLVQDLEEELEMKDSLTMQELTINYQKSEITDDVSPHNLEQSMDIEKAKDESYSKIEKELEAELEMLEMNMTSSTLERRISDLYEVDPDFEPGMAHGELRADVALDNRNQDESETPSANYAVSPRELSLRLHELLQSQLEERIKELEAEIESKSIKTQDHNKSWKDVSSGDEIENLNVVDDEPVVLNLSGEALDAYNEACNEFAKFDDDDDDEYEDDDEGDDGLDGTPFDERGDDKDFDEDEMEKMLIKHIVEKARQGSPMVLNAQRALFSELNL